LPQRIGGARRLRTGISELNLFGYRERVINLDAKIPDRSLDLGAAE